MSKAGGGAVRWERVAQGRRRPASALAFDGLPAMDYDLIMGKSNIEVEAKARISDPDRVLRAVESLAEAKDSIDFRDTYFVPGDTVGYSYKRFRLRRQGDYSLVTAKEKFEEEGVEASREHEFEVSDPEAFVSFVRLYGFKVLIDKRKHGRRFTMRGESERPAVIELVEVDGLGHFVEVEVMVEEQGQIGEARKRISGIMAGLGVKAMDIEPLPYTLLLYNREIEGRVYDNR